MSRDTLITIWITLYCNSLHIERALDYDVLYRNVGNAKIRIFIQYNSKCLACKCKWECWRVMTRKKTFYHKIWNPQKCIPSDFIIVESLYYFILYIYIYIHANCVKTKYQGRFLISCSMNITLQITGRCFQVAWFTVITYSQYDCTMMTWCLNMVHRTLRS